MKKVRSSRRSHLMLRNAGIDDTGVMTMQNSIPPCLKMWFPCNETSGSIVTDVVNGVELTPDYIEFGIQPYGIALQMFDPATLAGRPPTSGALPIVADKDFILFSTYQYRDGGLGTGRPENFVLLGDLPTTCFGTADGDASILIEAGITVAKLDSFVGGTATSDLIGGIAQVRHGRKIATWLHNNQIESPNPWPAVGDVFCETALDDHIVINGSLTATEYYSDYAPDIDPTLNYTTYPELGYVGQGFPGIWGKLPEGYTIPSLNTMTLGRPLAVPIWQNDAPVRFGIALFVFENGLPADWKTALRWMRDQWIAGNKVIWPNWVSVT